MLDAIWHHMHYEFWRSLVCLCAGAAAVAPALLVPAWRRRIFRSDVDLEEIGLLVLVVLIVAIGCYNYLGSSNGAEAN